MDVKPSLNTVCKILQIISRMCTIYTTLTVFNGIAGGTLSVEGGSLTMLFN